MRIIGSASSSGLAGGALGIASTGAGIRLRGATGADPSSASFAGGALGIATTGVEAELRGATGTASSSAGFAGGALGVGSLGAKTELRGAASGATGAEGRGGAFGTGWLAVMGCGDVGGRDVEAHAGGETGVGRPTDPAKRGVRRRADGGEGDTPAGGVPAGTAAGRI